MFSAWIFHQKYYHSLLKLYGYMSKTNNNIISAAQSWLLCVYFSSAWPQYGWEWAGLPHPEAWYILTCSVVSASWLLGTFPSSHCSPSTTSIIALVRKMALTWWVGRSVFSYHMLEIVRGCSRQDWLLLVPGNRPFKKPAKKNTNKNLKRTNFHISNFVLGVV